MDGPPTKEFEQGDPVRRRPVLQYEAVPGVKLNGKLTAGENIADIGGISLAHDGLVPRPGQGRHQRHRQGARRAHRPSALLRRERLLLVPAHPARVRAGDSNRTNRHPTSDEYRVHYVLAHQPEFREAFACGTGKPMSPAKACRVW